MKKTIIKSSLFAIICLLAISSKSFAQNDEPSHSYMKFDSCYLKNNFKTIFSVLEQIRLDREKKEEESSEYEPKKPYEYECLKCKRYRSLRG